MLSYMSRHTAYERALNSITRFYRELDGSIPASARDFFVVATSSLAQFAGDDLWMTAERIREPAPGFRTVQSSSRMLPFDAASLAALFARNRCMSADGRDVHSPSKDLKSWLFIPVSTKKEAVFALFLTRRSGTYSKHDLHSAELLSQLFSQAFRMVRITNRKNRKLAEETRHAMLIDTQRTFARRDPDWSWYACTRDYSGGTGSDAALVYPFGQDNALVCTADVTADDADRQAGLLYLDTWFSILVQTSLDARSMISRLNTDMVRRKGDCYASVCLVRYIRSENRIEIAGCGNTGCVVFCHASMSVRVIEFGAAAGIASDSAIVSETVAVRPGDIICAFTDGVSGTRKRNGDLFGLEEIAQIVKKHYFLSANDLSARIMTILTEKEVSGVHSDDRTVQIIKVD